MKLIFKFLGGGAVDNVVYTALLISFMVIATTIHCQDLKVSNLTFTFADKALIEFQDIDGDRIIGRKTLPIQFCQQVSRVSFLISIIACSVIVPRVWRLHLIVNLLFLGFGAYVGARTYLERSITDDKRNFKTYTVSRSLVRSDVDYTFLIPFRSSFG